MRDCLKQKNKDRATNATGEHATQLLCSKSRVLPLKRQSLLRLELCASLLISQLYSTVKQSLRGMISKSVLWTDSTIVINCISSDPNRWKSFIGNRVPEIQSLTEVEQWHHVRSEDNPADILSRGLLPEQIFYNEQWFNGPNWLRLNEEKWPKLAKEDLVIEEETVTLITTTMDLTIFENFSFLTKLTKVVAYCIRFIHNTRENNRRTGNLTTEGIFNSRSLTQLTDNPSDLNVLTPAHSLIGDSLLTTPEPNYQDVPINRLLRWQHIRKLFQHMWKRWSTEYLSQLQTRTKWYSNNETRLKEGSMVILKEENLSPFKWKIGRIEKTFPGKDGVTRVMSIRTKHRSLKRAVNKLCLLPVEDN
ncbi:hypothetical protein Trydic_g19805 [Trypoxylus dichotomus]